jgi:fibronectin type 3 domain-containing protein
MIQLAWNPVPGAATYNLKRGTAGNGPYPTVFGGLVGTNFTDTAVTTGTTYYYVVTAVAAGGESANSVALSAAPLPSLVPPNIAIQWTNGQLGLSWPPQNLGWTLAVQTNAWNAGLNTNWVMISGSQTTTQFSLPYSASNGSVFLRLVY